MAYETLQLDERQKIHSIILDEPKFPNTFNPSPVGACRNYPHEHKSGPYNGLTFITGSDNVILFGPRAVTPAIPSKNPFSRSLSVNSKRKLFYSMQDMT